MKGILALTALLALASTGARGTELEILWDQSRLAGADAGDLPAADAGCHPDAGTSYLACDIRLDRPVALVRLTTFYTAAAPGAFAATHTAWLWVARAPEAGSDRPQGDPRRGGRLVPVTARLRGNHHELVAEHLDIVLEAGVYWISLTPIAPGGASLPEKRLGCRNRIGLPSAAFDTCTVGEPRWVPDSGARDAALLVEGRALPPAAAAGSDPSPWRVPR